MLLVQLIKIESLQYLVRKFCVGYAFRVVITQTRLDRVTRQHRINSEMFANLSHKGKYVHILVEIIVIYVKYVFQMLAGQVWPYCGFQRLKLGLELHNVFVNLIWMQQLALG